MLPTGYKMTPLSEGVRSLADDQATKTHVDRMESLAVLAGKTGHDLNNFLMAILGNTSLAMMEMTEDDTNYRYLKQVEQAANRASEFANHLLVFAGKGRCSFKSTDVSSLIHEMEMIIETASINGCEVSYQLKPNLPPVHADVSQMRQIVSGMLKNCCESMESGGEIHVRTGEYEVQGDEFLYLTRVDSETDFVYMEFEDCGTGMTESVARHMFDPFFSTKAKGRGLGLANIYGIVRAHLGNIIVHSEPGRGTRIRILFPPAERFRRMNSHFFPGQT
ncbi:MAG: ATP-binding protein [Candidatus Sumerlaeota bacterium]